MRTLCRVAVLLQQRSKMNFAKTKRRKIISSIRIAEMCEGRFCLQSDHNKPEKMKRAREREKSHVHITVSKMSHRLSDTRSSKTKYKTENCTRTQKLLNRLIPFYSPVLLLSSPLNYSIVTWSAQFFCRLHKFSAAHCIRVSHTNIVSLKFCCLHYRKLFAELIYIVCACVWFRCFAVEAIFLLLRLLSPFSLLQL